MKGIIIGVGAVAVAGGVLYLAYRHRQSMLAAQGAATPVPVGVTSIYDIAGTSAAATGLRLPSSVMVGRVPLNAGPSFFAGGPAVPPLSSAAQSSAFAAAASIAANAIPAVGPTVETRSGRGHF